MRVDRDAPLPGHPASRGFRELHPVEDHHGQGVHIPQQLFKFLGNAPGRENVIAVKMGGRLVIHQVVPPQDPAHRGQAKRPQGNLFMGETLQCRQRERADLSCQAGIWAIIQPRHFGLSIDRLGLLQALFAGRFAQDIVCPGAQNALSHPLLANEMDHADALQPQRPAGQQGKSRVQAQPGDPGGGVEGNDGLPVHRFRRGQRHLRSHLPDLAIDSLPGWADLQKVPGSFHNGHIVIYPKRYSAAVCSAKIVRFRRLFSRHRRGLFPSPGCISPACGCPAAPRKRPDLNPT